MYTKCTDLFLQNRANTCRLVCISNLLLYLYTQKFFSVAIDKGHINIFLLSNYETRV